MPARRLPAWIWRGSRSTKTRLRTADAVAFYLPMHTATRLAIPVIRRTREINPAAHLCAYGLYAPVNAELLRKLGVRTIAGGEFEEAC
jgi:pyocin large subunit-like protein